MSQDGQRSTVNLLDAITETRVAITRLRKTAAQCANEELSTVCTTLTLLLCANLTDMEKVVADEIERLREESITSACPKLRKWHPT